MSDKHLWDNWLHQLKYGIDTEETPIYWELEMPYVDPSAHDPGPESKLFYAKSGAQLQIKNDQKGKSRYEHALDLHHCTLDEARKALSDALHHCQQHDKYLLLIVHGKGSEHNPSILKRHVHAWFKQCPHIIGFTSAPGRLGGAGALLVRLKKKY